MKRVLMQAGDAMEAIRLRATRLKVWRRGQLLAHAAPQLSKPQVPGRAAGVAFTPSAPA